MSGLTEMKIRASRENRCLAVTSSWALGMMHMYLEAAELQYVWVTGTLLWQYILLSIFFEYSVDGGKKILSCFGGVVCCIKVMNAIGGQKVA